MEEVERDRSTAYQWLKGIGRYGIEGYVQRYRAAKGQPAQKGSGPRDVIQMDTVDLGEIYAFTAIETYTKEGVGVVQAGRTTQHGQRALEVVADTVGPYSCLAAPPSFARQHHSVNWRSRYSHATGKAKKYFLWECWEKS